MLKVLETPEETAHRCIRELHASLLRAGRRRLRFAETLDGLRLSINIDRDRRKALDRPTDDLPQDLKKARRSMQDTYRAIRALRDERPGPDDEVWPADVVAWLDEKGIEAPNSVDTVNHAIHDLEALQLVTRDSRGCRLGSSRAAAQKSAAATPEPATYASRVAGKIASQADDGESSSMLKQLIWVPGEGTEFGVAIADASGEVAAMVTERVGEMKVPSRTGRLSTSAAAGGELLRTDGKVAVVKFRGVKKEVTVRVLGSWQLKGLAEPEPVEVGAA